MPITPSSIYHLPFGSDSSVILTQGIGGGFSHLGRLYYSLDFALPRLSTVYPIGEGVVVSLHNGAVDYVPPPGSNGSTVDGNGNALHGTSASLGPGQLGNYVTVRHLMEVEGVPPQEVYVTYAHLSQNSMGSLQVGSVIGADRPVGMTGLTGAMHSSNPTGDAAHLHIQFGTTLRALGDGYIASAVDVEGNHAVTYYRVVDGGVTVVDTTAPGFFSNADLAATLQIEAGRAGQPNTLHLLGDFDRDAGDLRVSFTSTPLEDRNSAEGGGEGGTPPLESPVPPLSILRISLDPAGDEFQSYSFLDTISGDGRFAWFINEEDFTYFEFDLLNYSARPITIAGGNYDLTSLESMFDNQIHHDRGQFEIRISEIDGVTQLFLFDRIGGNQEPVSVSSMGVWGNAISGSGATISADGRFVYFYSQASNLVPDDTNNSEDLFVRDIVAGETKRVSISPDSQEFSFGVQDSGVIGNNPPVITFDGRYSTFSARDTVFPEFPWSDVFLHDLYAGTTQLVSSPYQDGDSFYISQIGGARQNGISDDGRFTVFTSQTTNIDGLSGDTDIFVFDAWTSMVELVSRSLDGGAGNGQSGRPAISDDGRIIYFWSGSSNLVNEDTNDQFDIFVVANPLYDDAPNPNDPAAGFAISPEAALEVDGEITFTITRSEDRLDTAETVYVSTTQTEGSVNQNDYVGVLNQPVIFAVGQASLTVTVAIVADDIPEADETFGLIVQANPTDPVGTFLASTTFTIRDAPEDPGPLLRPSNLFLEFAARNTAYREDLQQDEVLFPDLPADGTFGPSGYRVDQIFQVGDFFAVGLVSNTAAPILAIRGTTTVLFDWVANADSRGVGYTQFLAAWQRGDMQEWLRDNPGAFVTGHSQGGAQAQLLAGFAGLEGLSVEGVRTFNAPGISTSVYNSFDADLPTDVVHFISSGDIVSHAGERYLPGNVDYYDFNSPFLSFYPLNVHLGHWSQPGAYGVTEFNTGRTTFDALNGFESRALGFDTTALQSPTFSHLWSGGVDVEFMGFLTASAFISPEVAAAFVTRAGTEQLRIAVGESGGVGSGLGQEFVDLWRFWSDVADGILQFSARFTTEQILKIATATNIAATWTIETASEVGGWTASTWNSFVSASVNVLSSMVDWGADQWSNYAQFTHNILDAITNPVIDAASSLWNWITSAQPEVLVASSDETLTHSESTPALLVASDAGNTLISETENSQFLGGTGADTYVLTGGSNMIWGLPEQLNGDTVINFGVTDALRLVSPSVYLLGVDRGSAILRLDTNGDGEEDTVIRLEGDYRLSGFEITEDADGALITYAGNAPPDVADDSATTRPSQAVVIPVLENDTDADGGTLEVVFVETPANGAFVTDGVTITYTPNAGFTGSDTFAYSVSDGQGGTDTATITVNVLNTAPVANDDTATTTAGVAVVIDVLANDTDPDGDALILGAVSSVSGGTVALVEDTFVFTPAPGFTGTGGFDYSVTDGFGGSDSARVSVTVESADPNPPELETETVTVAFNEGGKGFSGKTVADITVGDETVSERLNPISFRETLDFAGVTLHSQGPSLDLLVAQGGTLGIKSPGESKSDRVAINSDEFLFIDLGGDADRFSADFMQNKGHVQLAFFDDGDLVAEGSFVLSGGIVEFNTGVLFDEVRVSDGGSNGLRLEGFSFDRLVGEDSFILAASSQTSADYGLL